MWLYAPGALKPGKNLDIAGIQEMTGIQVRRDDASLSLDCQATADFGGSRKSSYLTTAPNFLPVGGYDTVAAYSGEKPVLVGRTANGRTDFFSAALPPPFPLLRRLMERAGGHSYQEGEDVLYAGNDFLVLHAVSGGIKKLRLPPECKARQLLGLQVHCDAKEPFWCAKPGQTYGFMVERQ